MVFSKHRTELSIELLQEKPEGQYFDRKSAGISIPKLVQSIIAFANADGGTIAIGIKNRQIQGINSQGNVRINDFIQSGFDQCIPSVKYQYEYIDVIKENGNADRIVLLHIEASKDRTHKNQSDEVFLRVGDENKKLSFAQRLQMEYDKGERSFEDKIIPECTLDDLDDQVLGNYQLAVNYGGDDILKLLKARGFAKPKNNDVQITNAGVLLFAKYPTTFLPNARVRFIKYEGSKAEVGTGMNIIKQETIEGPIPKVIEEVKNVIQSQLRNFTALHPLTGKFVSMPEYPTFAWQEGIINAITHRAYNLQGEDIRVTMFDDRLEILSPGKFPNIVNKDNIREVRYSRNPRIARVLTELGWVRELGEGVKRIFEEMRLFYLDEPIYDEPSHSVLLVLKNNIVTRRQRRQERIGSLISKEWTGMNDEEKRALEIAYIRDKITTRELADTVERSPNYARKILNNLEARGFLKLVSSSKTDPNQYFQLIDYTEK